MTTDYNQEELLVNWPHRGAGADSDDRLLGLGDTLLEHWPKRNSSMTTASFDLGETDDDVAAATSLISNKKWRVDFSQTSQLCLYERESKYLLRSLAYNKEDRNEFGKDALLEGLRIKSLITAAPLDSASESLKLKYLLRHDIISRDELIGIEHFVLGKPSRVVKMRKRHAAAVLWKQHEQQEQDPVMDLGKFAQSSSLRSTQGARIRACRWPL